MHTEEVGTSSRAPDSGLVCLACERQRTGLIVTGLAGVNAHADAHTGPGAGLHHFGLENWNGELWLLALLTLTAGLYALGVKKLWRKSDRGMPGWRVSAFYVGWLALVIALVSPLDALGNVLFSAHMLQHELLMLVAAPLLVLGKPLAVFAWGLPPAWTKTIALPWHTPGWQSFWRWCTTPLTAWSVHALAVWAWHAPALFQAGLRSEGVHVLQHTSFLLSALLFWWALLRTQRNAAAALYVFTTGLHTGALGALLTFAPALWYPFYAGTASAWGLSPLEDQQLGGLIMWVPGGAILMIAGMLLFSQWLFGSARAPTARVARGDAGS